MPSKNREAAWSPAVDSPQSQQAVQSSSDFFWVDYGDGKSQDAEVSRTTQAFLQKKYHKLRRKTQLQELKASMKALPPAQSTLPSVWGTGSEDSSEKGNPNLTEVAACQILLHEDDYRMHHIPQTKVENILPFVSRRSKQSVDFYFDYFRVQGSRRWYPRGQSEMLNCILQQSLDRPALLEVMLSMSAHDHAMNCQARGASSEVVRHSLQDAFYIRSHVIRSIQALFNEPKEIYSEAAVLVIGHLFVTEALEGNVKAVDAHTEGLQRIVNALGGVEKMSEWPLANIYSCDPIRGMMRPGCPLAFDIPMEFETKCLQALAERARPLRKKYPELGSSFFKSPWADVLHPRLGTIVRSFQDALSIYEELICCNTDLPMVDHNCALLLANRLHALPYEYDISSLNETIRLAITVYILTRIWEFQASIVNFIPSLRDHLEENSEFLEKSAPDLLFWILFSAAFGSMGFESHPWFVKRLQGLARDITLIEWEEVASVMEGFLFVRRPPNDSAQEFWEKVTREADVD